MKPIVDLSKIVNEPEVFDVLRTIQKKAFIVNIKGIIRSSSTKNDLSPEFAELKKALQKNNGSRFDGLNEKEMFRLIVKPAFFIYVGKTK
jgi:hypothetical protein